MVLNHLTDLYMVQFGNHIPRLYLYGMVERKIQEELWSLSAQFKAVAIVGPRQSGKTTIVGL